MCKSPIVFGGWDDCGCFFSSICIAVLALMGYPLEFGTNPVVLPNKIQESG